MVEMEDDLRSEYDLKNLRVGNLDKVGAEVEVDNVEIDIAVSVVIDYEYIRPY